MKQCFLTQKGPKAIGPYSSCVLTRDMAYLSGMLGAEPETGALVEGGAQAQAKRAIQNIEIVLSEIGLTLAHVVKTTVFLKNLDDFQAINRVYAEYFGANYPARSCVEVSRLPMGGLVEIEVIAAREI